ncbi:hypothetical protein [Bacillus infantis]
MTAKTKEQLGDEQDMPVHPLLENYFQKNNIIKNNLQKPLKGEKRAFIM